MTDEGPSILVVDDGEEIRRFYQEVLGPRGFLVRAAASGAAALESVHQDGLPDLIITDVVMPGMDGFQLLARLAFELGPSRPPAIVCSAFEITEQQAREQGAVMFLHKPLDRESLIWAVELVLAGANPPLDQSNRARAAAARRNARQLATVAAGSLDRTALARRGQRALAWLRTYFDCESAAVLLPGEEGLELFVASGAALPVGTYDDPARLSGPLRAVLETGTPLLVGDLATQASFRLPEDGGGEPRFLVAVPLCPPRRRTPVAVLTLADRSPRNFELEDLAIVTHFGRRSGMLVRSFLDGRPLPAHRVIDDSGLLDGVAFSRLLGLELRLGHRLDFALDAVVVDFASAADLASAAPGLVTGLGGPRAAVGQIGPLRLGVFARSSVNGEINPRELVDRLEAYRAAAVVRIGGAAVPLLTSESVFDLANQMLENGTATEQRRVLEERVRDGDGARG